MFSSTAQAAPRSLMPVQGSTVAGYVDSLYIFLLIASFIACVLVIGGFIYFAIRYRRRGENDKTAYITHNNTLEFAWSFIPFVIFMVAFGWGWWVYDKMRSFPENALEVHVTGYMWAWDFMYKNGKRTTNEFTVPVNTPVKLIMTSRDVIHSFFVPAFRVKQDVVPGRYSALWFEATKKGRFQVFCTEYCGTGHSAMLATVNVVDLEEYEDWLQVDPYRGLSLAQIGQQIFEGRCLVCHSPGQDRKVGPGLGGLFGSQVELDDGTRVLGDENYIRESILYPNEKITAGYPAGVMPTFLGQLDETEVLGLIEYIKSLE